MPLKQLTIILLFSYCLTTKAQLLGIYTTGFYTEKYLEKSIDKEINKGKKKKRVLQSSKNNNGDTLIYSVLNEVEGFAIKFTFKLEEKELEEFYCDFQELTFDCTPCSQRHLDEILSLKMYGFRKISENKYLSKYSVKTEMEIKYKSDNKDCMIMIFRNVNMAKKDYLLFYNSLSK